MPFDLSLPVLLMLALGFAMCSAEASAQTRPSRANTGEFSQRPVSMDEPSDVAPEDASPLFDSPPREAALEELAAQTAEAARRDSLARAEADARAAIAAAEALRLATPVVYATGYGLRVTLPGGWEGPVSAQEDAFPGYALYIFENARADRAVPGARLRVERIGTLNPLERERWRRGQSPYGLHGLRPVAPVDASTLPLPAQAAVAVEGDGVRGLTAYTQRGSTWWAVQASVPAVVYDADPTVLADLLGGLLLPGGDEAPAALGMRPP